jgi:biopolymer transport protein ExbD
MQAAESGRLQSAINVTPLVDVVLVLLITFMIVAPQMQTGPNLKLPATEQPPKAGSQDPKINVTLEHGGGLWVEGRHVSAPHLAERVQQAAARQGDRQVLIHGDARLTFGEVRQALRAVEAAGLRDVGLVAERLNPAGPAD